MAAYYRVERRRPADRVGAVRVLEPRGHYEMLREDGEAVEHKHGGGFHRSPVAESCFAETPGGCLLGYPGPLPAAGLTLWACEEVPDAFPGRYRMTWGDGREYPNSGDFAATGEVRYRRPVTVTALGFLVPTPELHRLLGRTRYRCSTWTRDRKANRAFRKELEADGMLDDYLASRTYDVRFGGLARHLFLDPWAAANLQRD